MMIIDTKSVKRIATKMSLREFSSHDQPVTLKTLWWVNPRHAVLMWLFLLTWVLVDLGEVAEASCLCWPFLLRLSLELRNSLDLSCARYHCSGVQCRYYQSKLLADSKYTLSWAWCLYSRYVSPLRLLLLVTHWRWWLPLESFLGTNCFEDWQETSIYHDFCHILWLLWVPYILILYHFLLQRQLMFPRHLECTSPIMGFYAGFQNHSRIWSQRVRGSWSGSGTCSMYKFSFVLSLWSLKSGFDCVLGRRSILSSRKRYNGRILYVSLRF